MLLNHFKKNVTSKKQSEISLQIQNFSRSDKKRCILLNILLVIESHMQLLFLSLTAILAV